MRLTRYVVVELKTGKFQPEYAGKLNFYVALVDDVLWREHHNETIGILKTTEASDIASDAQYPRWPSPPTPTTNCPQRNRKHFPTRDTSSPPWNGGKPESEVTKGAE